MYSLGAERSRHEICFKTMVAPIAGGVEGVYYGAEQEDNVNGIPES
jgi:hypothetical protein